MPVKYIWNLTKINDSIFLNNNYSVFYCNYENVFSLGFFNFIMAFLTIFLIKKEHKLKIFDNDIKKFSFGFIQNSSELKHDFLKIIIIVNLFIIIQKLALDFFPV